jgi:hypothetical protein
LHLHQPGGRVYDNLWLQLKTPVQINWFDYWYSPKVDKVSFANYVGLVRKLTADGQTIFAVEVGKGFYKVQYGGTSKDLGKKTTASVAT